MFADRELCITLLLGYRYEYTNLYSLHETVAKETKKTMHIYGPTDI